MSSTLWDPGNSTACKTLRWSCRHGLAEADLTVVWRLCAAAKRIDHFALLNAVTRASVASRYLNRVGLSSP